VKTSVLTRRRVIAAIVVLVLAAAAYTAWLLYAAQRDLRAAEADARELRSAIEADDDARAQQALADLQDSAGSAESRTGGPWWAALTIAPVYGDDLGGVRALSASLHEVADGAAPALVGLTGDVDGLVTKGRVDLDGLADVGQRVEIADDSMQRALDEVDDHDSSAFVGSLRGPFEEYVDLVSDAASGLRSAKTATEVAPTMLGADGPRDYLLVFQNNAEIRSTGGLSGSWARLHTEDGRIQLEEQGNATDFQASSKPVASVSKAEDAVYGDVIARYFQDPLMVPDFPRAADLFDAFWRTEHPSVDLDGVLTLDTVGLSYLLRGTEPVVTQGYTLNPETVVQLMLNQVYIDIDDPEKQDDVFTLAAAKIFSAVTTGVTSPTELVKAVGQAVDERRLLVASFEDGIAAKLRGTQIAGELSGDDGSTPHVDLTVNDATGSKMSYYLDYDTEVRATSCADDVQQLVGSMKLRQTITSKDAARLPDYITGGGSFGVPVGSQQVLVRLYAPWGGKLGPVILDGIEMPRFTVATIEGREVMTVTVLTDGSKDVELRWKMATGRGQTGRGEVKATPKVVPGALGGAFKSAC
jgi:hypothetical protein